MVAFSAWLKDALVSTPGATRAVVKRELINAAREFYRETTALREFVGPETITAADETYDLNTLIATPAQYEVSLVLSAAINRIPLARLTEQPHGEYEEAEMPNKYFMASSGVLNLWPRPLTQIDDALTVYVSLIPKEAATALPDDAAVHYYDALRDGMLGRMHGHPAKPYTNPVLAEYHLKRFRNAIGKARSAVKTADARGVGWTFPRFGK
jgi:hypothetical protein